MPTDRADHIVRSYDEQLRKLRDMVARMGGLAERQVHDATQALARRDAALAAEVVARDAALDQLEREIEAFCIRILATRQPMAQDLRFIVAAMKVSHDLERIGDYARNGAKRSVVLAQQPALGSLNGFQRMSVMVQENLKLAIDALVNDDADAAQRVWASDEPIDNVYNGIFREMLTHMMEDPRNITAAIHLLFIAKNLERIGDHATNIAEVVHYQITGEEMISARPKTDDLRT